MQRTPLYDFHRSAGARLVDFAGWEMPLSYTGIVEEHHHTRRHASCFDVSHMGRVDFRGPDAEAFLEELNTRSITGLATGQSRYSHMCREDGGILDDVIVSRLNDRYLVVCNASNRDKLLSWWRERLAGRNVEIVDRTTATAMVAIQGPEAIPTMQQLLPFDVSGLKRYHFTTGSVFGAEYFVARSGYTGEDGLEVILPAHLALTAVQMMLNRSAELGSPIKPAGLGARDTLRTEAAMPLYGHELTEDWDPVTAGQAWVVSLDKSFIGSDVIQRTKRDGSQRTLVGFEVDSPRTPRQGAEIRIDGETVGIITSGVRSPTLEKTIAMGFVPRDRSAINTAAEIVLKSGSLPARIVPLPFYKRA